MRHTTGLGRVGPSHARTRRETCQSRGGFVRLDGRPRSVGLARRRPAVRTGTPKSRSGASRCGWASALGGWGSALPASAGLGWGSCTLTAGGQGPRALRSALLRTLGTHGPLLRAPECAHFPGVLNARPRFSGTSFLGATAGAPSQRRHSPEPSRRRRAGSHPQGGPASPGESRAVRVTWRDGGGAR